MGEWVGGVFGVTEWRGRFGGRALDLRKVFALEVLCVVLSAVRMSGDVLFCLFFLGKIWVVERG